MAISREKKEQIVQDYLERLSRSQGVVLADYRGLTTAQLGTLRSNLRETDASCQVIKNTLMRLALQRANRPVPEDLLDGPVAATYCFGEVPPVAKALLAFADETKILTLRGAILGDQVLDAEAFKAVADLPPRAVLLAHLLGAVQGPLASLVGVLTAPLRDLAYLLQARAEQAGEEQPAGA